MPHSQTLASMAWIRCHAKPPLRACVLISLLRFYAPLTTAPTPRQASRLNHSRGVQETMPHRLCDKNMTGGFVRRRRQRRFMNVCLPLLWSGNGMRTEGKQKRRNTFSSLRLKGSRREGSKYPDLASSASSCTPDCAQRWYQTCTSQRPGQRSRH